MYLYALSVKKYPALCPLLCPLPRPVGKSRSKDRLIVKSADLYRYIRGARVASSLSMFFIETSASRCFRLSRGAAVKTLAKSAG